MTNASPSNSRHSKVIIVGSGPAGYTAAIYASRAMLSPLLIAGFEPGGQLMITTEIENFPGFSQAVQGPWLMEQMRAQAEHVGAQILNDTIISIELSSRPFKLIGDSGAVYTCDALIIATGAKAKWLELPSEEHFKGFGVSACATCDGFFYRGKQVIVVGGGNSAVEEALYLANIASRVTIIHRRDHFRAEKILQERLFSLSNVNFLWNHKIDEICGTDNPRSVTHVMASNVTTGELKEVAADGVFVAIGHQPASEIFSSQVETRSNGYIKTRPGTTQTNIPGVFAAGDVADDIFRQAVTAAGFGCMAALEAERFLSGTLNHSS